jgi:hypothetical protein
LSGDDIACEPCYLGIDTSAVVQEDDVGYTNQILASEPDDATMKAKILRLLEEIRRRC